MTVMADRALPLGRLHEALEALPLGIMVVDAAGKVTLCNRFARERLGPPDGLAKIEVSPNGTKNTASFTSAGGRTIEVTARPLGPGGAVILAEDVTEAQARDRDQQQLRSEHRSLFENSVYGIYRDTLDGQPVRVNPALAALNGYASEAEHIAAVKAHGGDWYVAEGRAAEFRRILDRDGRVKDFVSEVRRHRTGERLWITENAWFVRDAGGAPLYIEGTIQDATERMAAQDAMEKLVAVDALTGAASRFQFMRKLGERAADPANSLVLYCIDLDMFKDVNDSLGHAAGDAVLKAVADRLFAIMTKADVVARLGGDEFAILTSDPRHTANPAALAETIIRAMRDAVPLDGRSLYIGASAGVAVFPADGAGAGELLKSADLALYKVKSSGGNGWCLFDHELRESLLHRKAIESELRGAIACDELDLHFQPVVNAITGRTVGFEALMRWNHPQFGMVPPADFIPIAEQAGLMTELGAWVISRACEAAAVLPPPIKISVNVSASQFRSAGFFTHVKAELARCGIAPARIALEITESVLMSNEKVARDVLDALRDLGVKIAIDDFGTGYSSLSYLQHFPISVVKIDRSFVAGLMTQKANLAVIRAVMGIGRDLGINVVAEGVETAGQAAALEAEGCRFMQGYLFGRPKPLADAVTDLALAMLPRTEHRPQLKTA